jgi:2-polyprenyl-3-methyl-5-hydroxy-6-metoxy-1,4-benzoquinol methylase
MAVSFAQFDKIYLEAVQRVFAHWNAKMQETLAKHCYGWHPTLFNFENYLKLSSQRFYRAYTAFSANGLNQRICDVGGFWGVFPITLKMIGFEVVMTESLQYYGSTFDDLFGVVEKSGVSFIDYDPFEPDSCLAEEFDVVTVMAVLEHYPHSLRPFMENVIRLMKADGRLYLEVPNIAYWPKRVGLMRGNTPQAQLADIYRSAVPFIGHHHEFTIAELRELARLSGLRILSEDFFNYSNGMAAKWKTAIRFPIQSLAFQFMKDTRECLAILCEQSKPRT